MAAPFGEPRLEPAFQDVHAKKPALHATVANHSLTLSAVGSADTEKRLSDGEDGVGT